MVEPEDTFMIQLSSASLTVDVLGRHFAFPPSFILPSLLFHLFGVSRHIVHAGLQL